MKQIIIVCLVFFLPGASAVAQQVPRTVIAEHFTNTYCGICASRNPGLYANMRNYPQVLHIAYHPSSPYSACPLNIYNRTENDARTHYYGVYGGTPQLAVNGAVVGGSFTDPAIFTSELDKTSSFEMKVYLQTSGSDSVMVRTVIKKVDTSSLSSLLLFGVISEDTLFFSANNGETVHHDVFRKSVWGAGPLTITVPAAVGDSVVYTNTAAIDPVWVAGRVRATAILQQADNEVVQAARSEQSLSSAGTEIMCAPNDVCIYPNPATTMLMLGGDLFDGTARIMDMQGKMRSQTSISKQVQFIDVSSLPAGMYFLHLEDGQHTLRKKFVKN